MATFDELNCTGCGCLFGMPTGYLDNRRKDKKSFYCPNGHSMSYLESEADKLRRERDNLKQQQARLAWRKKNATHGQPPRPSANGQTRPKPPPSALRSGHRLALAHAAPGHSQTWPST